MGRKQLSAAPLAKPNDITDEYKTHRHGPLVQQGQEYGVLLATSVAQLMHCSFSSPLQNLYTVSSSLLVLRYANHYWLASCALANLTSQLSNTSF